MAVELNQELIAGNRVLVVRAGGKLSKEDYEQFIPACESLINEQARSDSCLWCRSPRLEGRCIVGRHQT